MANIIEKGSKLSLMAENTLANSKTTSVKVSAYSSGLTVILTQGILKMAKFPVRVHIPGQMADPLP